MHITLRASIAWLHIALLGLALGAREIPLQNAIIDTEIPGVEGLAAADVDGDGDLDLFAAATGAVNILWLENNGGDGSSWTTHTIDSSFNNALRVAAGDLDGDGDIDLVAAANLDNAITWWENDSAVGDGSSWDRHDIDTSYTGAAGVALADVDGDGHPDVLAIGAVNGEVTWFENANGDASMWTENTLTASFNGGRAIVGADFDGDGDTDVLATGDNDQVTWWENTNGLGTLWTSQTIDGSFTDGRGVHAADLDGDGDLDVLASSEGDDLIIWYENDGAAPLDHGAAALDYGAGSFNGDSAATALTWVPHTINSSFDGAYSVFAADLDDDGDLDVLGTSSLGNEVTWWENTDGVALAWNERTLENSFSGTRFAAAADIDQDGDLDVFASAVSLAEVSWWENETIHRTATHPEEDPLADAFTGSYSLAVGDLDGDGDKDIAAVACPGFNVNSCAGGEIAWWENTAGDASNFTKHALPDVVNGPVSIEIVDIDNDGDRDLLTFADASDIASWWENDGTGSFTESVIRTLPFNRIASADVDGDGDLDIVTSSKTNKAIDWFANDGSGGTWTFTNITASLDDARSVVGADIDGDGDTDIVTMVLAVGAADPVDWWENQDGVGQTWSSAKSIDADFNGAFFVSAADMDMDGDIDVLGAADGSPDILSWFENTSGDGSTWATHDISCPACAERINQPRFILGTDLDDDGDTDIIGTGWKDGGRLDWYENVNGDGLVWTLHILTDTFDGARWAAAADMDMDGDVDILAAAQTDGDLSYWQNRGGQFALPTADLGAALGDGVTAAVLRITAVHRGRVGDQDLELTSFELLLEETAGSPLTSGEANAILENLSVYRDDGDQSFDILLDTPVTTVASLSLNAGVQTIPFADGDPTVQIAHGTPVDFFVVLKATDTFTSQLVASLLVTHITEASSTADDADHDIDLQLEFVANVSSSVIPVNDSEPLADLEVEIIESEDPVMTGAAVSYTLSVINHGPHSAENVQLTTTLDGPIAFVSTSGGCVQDPAGLPMCSLGTISAFQTVDITLQVVASSDTPGTATVDATVSATTTETNPTDNTTSESTTVQGSMTDLQVTQGVSPTHFVAGTTLTYFITVRNAGPIEANGALVNDTFPLEVTGVTWTCIGSGGASCTSGSGNGDLTGELIDLPTGSAAHFRATGTATGSSDFSNTASTTPPGGLTDPNTENNSANALSIAVAALLFVGDFEEGNLSEWSTSVGGTP